MAPLDQVPGPDVGVWSDGYYMSINQFSCNFMRCRWAGQGVVAKLAHAEAKAAGQPPVPPPG